MYVLDTNHLRELVNGTPLGDRLRGRLDESRQPVVTTVVNADECLRGWLALIAAAKSPERECVAYLRLNAIIDVLADLIRLPYDTDSAGRFLAYRKDGVRIGSKDLKIACIAIEYGAILLTRNAGDFSKVHGLKFENWLD